MGKLICYFALINKYWLIASFLKGKRRKTYNKALEWYEVDKHDAKPKDSTKVY